jgi:hypothetical protein
MDSIRWLPSSFHVQPMMISLAWAGAMAGARKEGGGCRGHFLSARTESGWADHGAQPSRTSLKNMRRYAWDQMGHVASGKLTVCY